MGTMDTWTITLKIRPDGGAEVVNVSYGIPPGELEIRGRDDGNRATIAVRQRDGHGRFVIAAHHTRDRAEEAVHAAEDTLEAMTVPGPEAARDSGEGM